MRPPVKQSLPPQKILFFYWDLGLGGIQKKIYETINDLHRTYPQVEIHLLLNKFDQHNSYQTLFLSKLSASTHLHIEPEWRVRRFIFPYIFYVIFFLLTHPTDIIVSYNHRHNVTACAAKFLIFWKHYQVILNQDIPLSFNLTDMYHSDSRLIKVWKQRIARWYPHANLILVPAPHIKRDLEQHFQIKPHQIKVIPNWTIAPAKQNTGSSPTDLLYIGRLSYQKNPFLFPKLIQSLHKENLMATLKIIGEGDLRDKLKAKINKAKLDQWIKLEPPTLLSSAYPNGKIFILTSIYEGEPLSVLEAYAHKIPVIALHYPGIESCVIDGQTGIIAQNLSQMTNAIIRLLNQPKLYHELSQGAYHYSRHQKSRHNLTQYTNIILQAEN